MSQLRDKLQMILNYSQIENVQYILSKYMMHDYPGGYKLSIKRVVDDTLISKSSVLKFCKYLGYDTWKTFSVDLQNAFEEEAIRLDSIKIDIEMLYTKKLNVEHPKNAYLKYWEKYHLMVGKEQILKCIEYINRAEKIVVIGDILEVNMFLELQKILLQYNKVLEFPKLLHTDNLKEQLTNINEDTLIIFCDSRVSWETFKEHDTLHPLFYVSQLIASKTPIVYIGQGEYSGINEEVYQIGLPFSYNENFRHLVLQEFLYQLGHLYIYTH
ncbi:MAG: hypothetical protein ACK5LC_17860 [Coprobacillaceae bacterium]